MVALPYGRLKTKENCKLVSLKVVAVAYERRSLTRGSNYSDLNGEILVVWKSGRSRKGVAREILLYINKIHIS